MTSTFTPNKNLEKPANGDYVNTWSTPVNNDWTAIDTAFGGLTNLNATSASGNVTLTSTQYTPPDIVITGTPSGNLSYQLPGNVGGFWSVLNGTTGNATVGISSAGAGSSITVTQGFRTAVISDGNGNVTRFDNAPGNPAGSTGQVQYNSSGVLAGSANLVFTGSNVLGLKGTLQFTGATSGFVQFVAASTSTPTTWILPAADGSIGQVLSTNGSGTLSWVTASSGGGVTSVNGRTGAVAIISSDVTGALGYTPVSTSADTSFTAGVQTTPSAVAFSATAMTVNCALSNVFSTTFTANVTSAPTLSNPGDGQTINWFITQNSGGSRTMTWPASFKWPGGTPGVLSTAGNAVDLLVATYRAATSSWYANLLKGFA